ncbi:MAG: phosphatidylglycerol lysyltransferase domain-containing protein [Candidatus Omnitrophota bacterium]
MKLKELSLKEKPLFKRFLGLASHRLAVFAFENIYIWKALFKVSWAVVDNNLCVFFKDRSGCFLYLPPLGRKVSPAAIEESFRLMDSLNSNKEVSRIENVEEPELGFYRRLGLSIVYKSCDYLCRTRELASLEGNRFKSKRAGFNYFIKHYSFEYLPFTPSSRRECLDLYAIWSRQRKRLNQDKVYQGMIADSGRCLEFLLKDYRGLDLFGRLVRIEGKVKAFTFGFVLNPGIFCVLYEITDLNIRGLAQFIFRRFSSELKYYRYLNIMDDSGLENLKEVKLSYRPVDTPKAYIIQR